MSNLIKLENAFVFITVIISYIMFGFSLWVFLVFLLVPDISMFGYLVNNKIGSYIYNVGHSYISPILLTFLYLLTKETILLEISLIWLGHISMDRTIGFGLKYKVDFKNTTIQKI
ncbi:DUF4260 domain-containing protein [Staphylococcus kloosii]|jgi:hypothetical protein|uniref:DUF4260 domain-containing protein n=1 Tax=Staphylococcus kloosii TaxID=29384 RepID=UPI0018A0EE1F|nr:DUF4260 domain-containing protein [Staphylococcus kloosii]MBF7023970.1 DUF4260 domain-containing protein [Staphylococcus kloosii]